MKKILLILALGAALSVGWYMWSLSPLEAADQSPRSFTIPEGMPGKAIGERLEEKGIIRSAKAFTLYVRLHRVSLQAGDFMLRPSMSVSTIVDLLHQGRSEDVSITIPEGFTVEELDALIAEKELAAAGDLMTCARTCVFDVSFLPHTKGVAKRGGQIEGYLFPDTYFVTRKGFTSEKFLLRLLGNFRERVINGLAADLKASKRSLSEIITMASLIEEEAKTDAERPIIAGILWKRLDAKQGLGVDASTRYAVDKKTDALTVVDLAVDSPYNLRKYRGLPPGPIANPGLASIKAALHPVDTEYWYYLHGNDGEIHYAMTNDEHNKNRALYLR